MNARFARGECTTDDERGRTILDVSGVETERVTEYVSEWFADCEVHLERKGGTTVLVAGE
jgi:hypothetical protein